METNKKVGRKIKIATILLSVEILFSMLSLSSNSLTPVVSILAAAILIYLIHKMTKSSYNNARVLLIIIFFVSSMSNSFTLDSQYPALSMVVYVFQITLWATVFFLINSVYKQAFSKKTTLAQDTSSPLTETILPVDLNKKINPKILIWIFGAPFAVAIIIGVFSWLFNSN